MFKRRYYIFLLIVLNSFVFSQNIKRKGFLGVGLYETIPDSLLKKLQVSQSNGSLIKFIVPKSTAAILKLRVNDIITSVNNRPIDNTAQLLAAARSFRANDLLNITFIRNGKNKNVSGKIIGKPYENSTVAAITYGEFKFENGYIRTILKKPKAKNMLGVVYFVQGIGCYSLDNMNENDPTRLAIDAMVKKGFAVYSVEKSGMVDNVNTEPCPEIGYKKELQIYREGYLNLKKLKDIDTSQVFIFGHSLGGVSAPLLAQEFQPKGVIVYGTVLKPWSDYLMDVFVEQQYLSGGDLAALRDTAELLKPTFTDLFYNNISVQELIKSKQHLFALQRGLGYDPKTNLSLAGRTLQFHKEINDHNLAKAWKNTDSFVMAIYGEADIAAINPIDHKAIINYVNEVHPGKGTFLPVPKTNHTFQEVGTMDEFLKMQSDPVEYEKYASQHFNTKLFDTICDWMNDKLAKKL